tara:strand:+ start:352 stop:495 length:144 start_codon:yes stop_codon:yes gene_type:complete
MNISKLSVFALSVTLMVYIPASKPLGIIQGRKNVSSDVIEVANDTTT